MALASTAVAVGPASGHGRLLRRLAWIGRRRDAVFGGMSSGFRSAAASRAWCYARQIFQRLQAVSAGGTWQHGAEMYQWRSRRAELFARREEVPLGAMVASTIARPSKVDASVQF
uniref:Uncharacterized protein n=1 Tax=Aegilops tauschii TaxID=37682 RepID=Q8LLA1_AEGTA|nr:unknown [Aegilops tauschii]